MIAPMPRKRFPVAATLSAVLCAGTCALWGRSAYRSDHLTVAAGPGGRRWWVESAYGGLTVTAVEGWPRREPWQWRSFGPGLPPPPALMIGDVGFSGWPLIPDGRGDSGALGLHVS